MQLDDNDRVLSRWQQKEGKEKREEMTEEGKRQTQIETETQRQKDGDTGTERGD